MVKGISRQVIVVKAPDEPLFEQAIFILRDDAVGKNGISQRQLLRQAKEAAGYPTPPGGQGRMKEPLCVTLGAVAMGLVWLVTSLL